MQEISKKSEADIKKAGSALKPHRALAVGFASLVAAIYLDAPTAAYVSLVAVFGCYLIAAGFVLGAVVLSVLLSQDEDEQEVKP